MQTILTVIHVVACLLLIPVILIQQGKGADISASFGGSSQTVFGSSGGATFFTRLTTVLAAVFMLTSLTLTSVTNQGKKKSVFEGAVPAATTESTSETSTEAPPAAADAAPAASAEKPAGEAAKN